MARRRSTGDYILSFLAGGISGYAQGSQMQSAMNSKAALEERKAKAKRDEVYGTGLKKTVDDIKRPYSERMGAWEEWMKRNPDQPLPQPEFVQPEQPKTEGPSKLDVARRKKVEKETDLLGKRKPTGSNPIDRKTQELNTISDDFKALEVWKQSGDDNVLAGYFGEESVGKDSEQLDALMKKRVEDFDAKWGTDLGSTIYKPATEEPLGPQLGPPTEALMGGGDESRKMAEEWLKQNAPNEPLNEENIQAVIKNKGF